MKNGVRFQLRSRRHSASSRIFFVGVSALLSLAAYVLISPVHRVDSKATTTSTIEQFEPYLHYLHEFTERRRVNVYFKNEQSIFHGAQLNYVNTGRGNLTFVRRDLVTSGRMPLMVARVHDSSNYGNQEFGPGWKLSAAETIEVRGDLAHLHSETSATITFRRAGSSYVLVQDYPSDYAGLTVAGNGGLFARLRTGLTKEFTRLNGTYRLTRVTDRNGSEARLVYEGDRLRRIATSAHAIEFAWGTNGRIVEARDEIGRSVRYQYDEKGMLTSVVDIGGNTWTYQHTGKRQLHKADDPQGRENLKVWYGSDGRVRAMDMPSGRVSYEYDDGKRSTTVTSRKNLVSRFFHNQEGIHDANCRPARPGNQHPPGCQPERGRGAGRRKSAAPNGIRWGAPAPFPPQRANRGALLLRCIERGIDPHRTK